MSVTVAGILLLAGLLLPILSALAGRLVSHWFDPRVATLIMLLGFGGSLGLAWLLLVSRVELSTASVWADLLPREGPAVQTLVFDSGSGVVQPGGEIAVAAVPLVMPEPEALVALAPTAAPVLPSAAPDRLPTATAPITPQTEVPASYIVQDGDTLRAIATRLGVSVEVLLAANGLEADAGDRLVIGQELRVPMLVAAGEAEVTPAPPSREPSATATPEPAPVLKPTPTTPPPTMPPVPTRVPSPSAPPSSEVRTYIVEQGDTLSSIARQFGMSVDSLLRFNGLSPEEGDQLSLGQRLYIPATARAPAPPALSAQAYIVKAGDTLRSIAEQFGLSVEMLLRFNGLTPAEGDQLRLGQKLLIPAQ
jgi:LysM repeat protein